MLKARDHTVDFAHASASLLMAQGSSARLLAPPSSLEFATSTAVHERSWNGACALPCTKQHQSPACCPHAPLYAAQTFSPGVQALDAPFVVGKSGSRPRALQQVRILFPPPEWVVWTQITPSGAESCLHAV